MSSAIGQVAIIGAGLAGTALGLALVQQNIPCHIYEAKGEDASQISSGVVLTPNGLLVLDKLGVFERIKSRCWKSEYRTFKNDRDEITSRTLIANEEMYGYKNHRLYRKMLLDEMKKMLQENGVPIHYNTKFERVIEDVHEGVTFQVSGRREHASILIGTDGIHSTVRKYLDPNVVPEYTGVVGVLSHINRSAVRWPYPDYAKACTIQGRPGAIFMIPEVEDGSEIMVGKQAQQPDRSPHEWEALVADKDKMCDFYREGYNEWHETAKSIIDAVCANKETLYLWPFMRMPRLSHWFSDSGRVIIVGDAAHALPPSSGQGVNQCLEDVWSLTLILSKNNNPLQSLKPWQKLRQERIDKIYDWATNSTNVQRMPEEERNKLIKEGKVQDPNTSNAPDSMSWLYRPNLDQFEVYC